MYGLEQVVNRLRLKSGHRILVVGGDKHQRGERFGLLTKVAGRAGAVPRVEQLSGGFQARHARHLNVKKQHIGPQLQRLSHSRCAVTYCGQHAQFRPRTGQLGAQRRGQQRLVFGNQGGGAGVLRVFRHVQVILA